MSFYNIYRSTPDQTKLEFIESYLLQSPEFQTEFIQFISKKGNQADEPSVNGDFFSVINEIETQYKEKFEAVDLENPDWENYTPPYSGYIEDWEQYQQASEQEFEAIFNEFKSFAFDLILEQKIDTLLAAIIGLYEACIEVEVDDPCDSFDTVNDYLTGELSFVFTDISDKIKKSILPGRSVNISFQNFFRYCNEEYPTNEYFPKYFENLLLALADKAINPEEIIQLLNNSKIDQKTLPRLVLLLNRNCGNSSVWLINAEKFYQHDNEVAQQLCSYYFENDNPKFLKLAKELFEKEKLRWSEYLQDYVTYDLDSKLFIDIFIELSIRNHEIKYYEKINSFIDEKQKQDLLSEVWYDKRFVVDIHKTEGQFEAIKTIVIANADALSFNYLITPIINIYPEFCFSTIEKQVLKSISNDRGRSAYRRIVEKLQLAKQINGYEKQTEKLIHQLYNYSPRLSALKDEFKIGKLV